MRISLSLGNWRLRFNLERMVQVQGVTSRLEDGRHFLMWDFDQVPAATVYHALSRVQALRDLSTVHVLTSGSLNWHAYCFTALPWPETIRVIAETEHVDRDYFRIGVWRGYFTLRFVAKPGRPAPMRAFEVPSLRPPDVDPFRIPQFVRYWTHG